MLDSRKLLRQIPSIDKLLGDPVANHLITLHGRLAVVSAYRVAVKTCRDALVKDCGSGESNQTDVFNCSSEEELSAVIHKLAEDHIQTSAQMSLRPVFNATGTVLHTNLGRALMPDAAISAMQHIAGQPSNLEFDLQTGRRGERDNHVVELICELTGAEAATVVNNNAAAVLIALNTVAEDASVAVSRGELVEIGGSFRIPDVMKKANCHLHEVGTTNRTHLKDFQAAIEAGVRAIMRVHTSNYRIDGFTATVDESELAALCHAHDLPFLNDLGSGVLVDLTAFGLPQEPTVKEAVVAGADIVTFSGDKLLGGPQCGILVGSQRWIDKVRKNPLKRALRTDKHTLAALEALLKLYRNPDQLTQSIPAMRHFTRSLNDIRQTAEKILPAVAQRFYERCEVSIETSASQIGSGALPVQNLDSLAIKITPSNDIRPSSVDSESNNIEAIARELRSLSIPVIGRIHRSAVWLDIRCIEDPDSFISNLA